MKCTTTLSFVLLSSAMVANVHCASGGIRGQQQSRTLYTDQYENIKFCGKIDTDADHDKYFWMTLVNGNKVVKGSCLLTIPDGTSEDSVKCCTVSGTTDYSTDYNLVVSDPHTITNTTSQAYQICGKNGGKYCSNYSYSDNQQGFGYFQIKDESGNGIRKMDKYVNGGAKCGLTDKLGTCHSGAKNVFGHVHVGKGYCLESGISLGHYCDGHYGYKCHDGDC